MALQLDNLDEHTRKLMVEELDLDLANGVLYMSPRLNQRGYLEYEKLLRTALLTSDDESLASEIRSSSILNVSEQCRKSGGGFPTVKVPLAPRKRYLSLNPTPGCS